MTYRTLIVALAACATASAASAQQTPTPQPPPAAEAEPAADEPLDITPSRESVTVRGARPLPVPSTDRPITVQERQRHQAESRCIVAAQDAPDSNEVDLSSPEEACRRPAPP